MVTSDFRPEVKIRPFRACAVHPAIIIGTVRSFIVDVDMGQIPRSTERISSLSLILNKKLVIIYISYASYTRRCS